MKCICLLSILLVFCMSLAAYAAPAYLVTSPPVINWGFTGPIWDPPATMGQWFTDEQTRSRHYAKPYEFYDDFDYLSIQGKVINVQYDSTGTNITMFHVLATVTNDLYNPEIASTLVSNAHNESLQAPIPYMGTMMDVKICAEFAIADMFTLPVVFQPPYFDDPSITYAGYRYYIEALNETELGWYCWTPENPEQMQPGDFYVPTWSMGDIPVGQSATVEMMFMINDSGVGMGMPPTDPRYHAIIASLTSGADILWNRSRSLKISNWIDTIMIDVGGYVQGESPETGSNASVFFDRAKPEPVDLTIEPNPNGGYSLNWIGLAPFNYVVSYTDDLVNMPWQEVVTLPAPGALPAPMMWIDDGTVIAPPVSTVPYRFYKVETK